MRLVIVKEYVTLEPGCNVTNTTGDLQDIEVNGHQVSCPLHLYQRPVKVSVVME